MGQELGQVARQLGCSERTVRRYIGEGLLHGRLLVAGKLELPEQERRYASSHWGLLAGMKKALRTERDVRLAVLYGSTAVGEDHSGSDLDLLVLRRSTSMRARAALSLRLSRSLCKPVHLVDLGQAEASPGLLADVLREGRPLLDRDGLWAALLERRDEIAHRASSDEDALAAKAQAAVLAARTRGTKAQAA